jgi:hypothetical protein
MWFLNFIPDTWLHWIIHGIVTLGILLSMVGVIGKNIPFISGYGLIIKSIGALLLIIGIFFEGGYGVEMSYRNRIAEMQEKIKVAETQSKETNTKIETKVVQVVKYIKENTEANKNAIEKNRDVINNDCKLSDTAWMLYNRSTQNVMAGSTNKSN